MLLNKSNERIEKSVVRIQTRIFDYW